MTPEIIRVHNKEVVYRNPKPQYEHLWKDYKNNKNPYE